MDQSVVRLRLRRSKIVATVGPACLAPEMIGQLIHQGVDVFRLNMSHGDHEGHAQAYRTIREVASAANRFVAILADLCGPKIRVGGFEAGGADLISGQTIQISSNITLGQGDQIASDYPYLATDVQVGGQILFDDGNLEARVLRIEGDTVFAQVVTGGRLKDRKGMNLPGATLSVCAPTEKDIADAQFACQLGVDYLALSFVRQAADLANLRAALGPECPPIIAKIEMPEALENIETIAATADGMMVARGDLGVELPAEDVPIVQDHLIDLGRTLNKPVIVATQMLDSMIRSPRPTRAEVTDISHAVWRGCDAVMLSGETAAGSFPIQAVGVMDKVTRRTEGYMWKQGGFGHIAQLDHLSPPLLAEDSFAKAVALMSRDLHVRAVIVVSKTGRSANVVSSARPAAPILALSDNAAVCRRMNLLWGVHPQYVTSEVMSRPAPHASRLLLQQGLAAENDHFLLVRGFSTNADQDEPSITVLKV